MLYESDRASASAINLNKIYNNTDVFAKCFFLSYYIFFYLFLFNITIDYLYISK